MTSVAGTIRSLSFKIAPRMATMVSSSRERRLSHRLVRRWGLFDLNQRLIADVGNRVVDGPFKGLVLTSASQREHIGPYLLGTYETELSPWWGRLLQRRFGQIIVVGAKFGYYAVGLATRFPDATVVAFDTDWWARRTVREMSKANHAHNVAVKGFCSPAWLARHLEPHALIVSDCEGAEAHLFCDETIAAFSTATIVIELHEVIVPGIGARIREVFRGTHDIDEIDSRSDTSARATDTSLTPAEMRRAAQEIRGAQKFLLLTPVQHGAAG